jgi:hypothetical protein
MGRLVVAARCPRNEGGKARGGEAMVALAVVMGVGAVVVVLRGGKRAPTREAIVGG